MTGLLILPDNSLAVGTNQLMAANGKVGIGMSPAVDSSLLTVNGDVNITSGLLRFNGTQISLSNLKNVSVGSPAMNQVLAFNGANWTNATLSNVSSGSNVSFYLNSQADGDIPAYKKLLTAPGAETEVNDDYGG